MQPTIGILMLETRFPRLYGDVGNPSTWPFPVRIEVVGDATPDRVVRRNADGLVDAFVAAGKRLADRGVDGITTTCGFLSLHQRTIATRLPAPFASSSLLQVPSIAAMLPEGRRVGIVTVESSSLSAAHLSAIGIDPSTPIAGAEHGTDFTRVLLGDLPVLDRAAALADLVDASRRLVALHPDVGAIVLECANMPPYANAIADALRLPVYDWYSMVCWFARGLRPRAFHALADARPAHCDRAPTA